MNDTLADVEVIENRKVLYGNSFDAGKTRSDGRGRGDNTIEKLRGQTLGESGEESDGFPENKRDVALGQDIL